MTVSEAARAIGASVSRDRPVIGGDVVRSVCTDTRRGCEGAVFFALRGERSDGHDYVAEAGRAGAVAAVVERHIEGADVEQLIVRDTLEALGDLARECVRLLDIPKIGVTGSVGKTTVRAMIAHVLSGRYNVRQSEGNQNNEIGVPLTLFGLTADHTAAVIEMGMRGRGQIAYLASIVKPTIAVVTNVGISHIELLGSQDAIADAKAEILDRLPPSGLAVLPRGDAYYDYLSRRCQCRVRSFALDESADFVATDAFVGPDGKG
ncbi:MAG: UDP-N-acetylmuramoyl-tripeptide--D-alanyl-D-alanine ligase, partial [Armatimonadetes bacterium]|nr:UDP-N-acetylmuramoyl-tripeptide--D-alanyl-D-alanine ligase [Armatimonadota bacterium]